MFDIKNSKLAIPLVIIAGLIWSFGPLVVRYIDNAASVPWQYLFTRGIVIFFFCYVSSVCCGKFDVKHIFRIKSFTPELPESINRLNQCQLPESPQPGHPTEPQASKTRRN